MDAERGAGLHFVADIDFRRGVVADKHDGKARRTRKSRYAGPALIENRIADTNAIENLSHLYEGSIVGRPSRRLSPGGSHASSHLIEEVEHESGVIHGLLVLRSYGGHQGDNPQAVGGEIEVRKNAGVGKRSFQP